MLKMNDHIRAYERTDYAGHQSLEPALDCSLGVNQAPLPAALLSCLGAPEAAIRETIKPYPHGDSLEQALAAWYRRQGLAWLTPAHFLLGNGSYGLLCDLNLLCLGPGKRVLGVAPQFSAYVDHVRCLGACFDYYPLPAADHYRFRAEDFLARMDGSHGLFILENPNNPTGQALPLADLRRIAEQARELSTILVVDEAYGDYLDIKASALNLLPDYANVVVTRSFSKGHGLAGLRLGYAAAHPAGEILPQLGKLSLGFNCNALGRLVAVALLESNADMLQTHQVAEDKAWFIAGLTRLQAAATSPATPILLLYDQSLPLGFDLCQHLLDSASLATVGCGGILGLDSRAVRLMLPPSQRLDELISMIRIAEAALPAPL